MTHKHHDIELNLKHQFGFDSFRQGQQDVVQRLLDGKSTIAIFPTGSGKSLCYQFTALYLPHLTLVVSPLLALMKDQLEFLQSHNIPAAKIDSSLSFIEYNQVISDVRSGQTKILMVSVERFKNERFRQFIESVPLSMLVVDEAHCISEWGHNFRPDYLKLPQYQNELNAPLALLLTATATKEVKHDMARKFSIDEDNVVQTGFYRDNLHLNVEYVPQHKKESVLLDYLSTKAGAGIVYVTLQHQADEVAKVLKHAGLNARSYHAGLKDDLRQEIQTEFMQGKLNIVVATIAFGMGIDKANIRFVVHYELPKSLESYSQEIGRAGRNGNKSDCYVMANLDNISTLENFVYGDTPEKSAIEALLNHIDTETDQNRWEMQLIPLSNQTNIRQLPLKTLLVQLELIGVLKPLYAYFAEFKFKFLVDENQILHEFVGERAEFLREIFRFSAKKKVWARFDSDGFFKRHPASRKRVVTALDYLHEKGYIKLQSKRNTEVFEVNSALLKVSELAKDLANYFQEKEIKELRRIASLLDFFQQDTCLSVNLCRYFDDDHFNNLEKQGCGHCHVCVSGKLNIPAAATAIAPDLGKLQQTLQELEFKFTQVIGEPPTMDSYCRFLAGIASPFLTRVRARTIQGHGMCAEIRYADIRQILLSLK